MSNTRSREAGRPNNFVDGNDASIERIRRNFYLETQSFRARVLDASDEAARASDRINDIHRELEQWKNKCSKLQRMVDAHESTISSLQTQNALKLPLMMNETMKSLQHMIVSDPHMEFPIQNSDVYDTKVHEFEKQIVQLYDELRDEKKKNEMLRECLLEQKQAKSKLVKACKFARKEIEALRHSGLDQLLNDMETKCQALEEKNRQLEQSVMEERTKTQQFHDQMGQLEEDAQISQEQVRHWKEAYHQKECEVQALERQIREQQDALEDFQQDYDLKSISMSKTPEHLTLGSADQTETSILMRTLQRERQRVAELETTLEMYVTNQNKAQEENIVLSSLEVQSVERIFRQVSLLHSRLYHLQHQLKTFNEGETSCLFNRFVTSNGTSNPKDLECLCDECHSVLGTIESLIEQSIVRELGNNCAMQ